MTAPITMNEVIADNLRKAGVQLEAAYKKMKKYDPDNKENAEAAIWLTLKVNELALEYQQKETA